MAKQRKRKRSDDTLFAACFALSLMGAATVAVVDYTDYRTGQRFVSVAEQKERKAAKQKPDYQFTETVLWTCGRECVQNEKGHTMPKPEKERGSL